MRALIPTEWAYVLEAQVESRPRFDLGHVRWPVDSRCSETITVRATDPLVFTQLVTQTRAQCSAVLIVDVPETRIICCAIKCLGNLR